jgi:protein-S-isoprenylcysteine O-methyltransferase Ste14
MFFLDYKPPKTLRMLFIVHYMPLVLIILIGPLTVLYHVWEMPSSKIPTIFSGMLVFLAGALLYAKWEIFWHKTYNGQLVTTGIFKHIRHPHYTSLIIIAFGLALFFFSLVTLILAVISIPIMVISIVDEEHLLIRQYGNAYREFMKQTPWRIIPKVF